MRSGTADKGTALNVLVAPRRLAHDHHPCMGAAIAEHQRTRAALEFAMLIGRHRRLKRVERWRGLRHRTGLGDRIGLDLRHRSARRRDGTAGAARGALFRCGAQGIAVLRRLANGLVRTHRDLKLEGGQGVIWIESRDHVPLLPDQRAIWKMLARAGDGSGSLPRNSSVALRSGSFGLLR